MGLRSWVWTHETAYCAVGYVYGVDGLDRQRVAGIFSDTAGRFALRRAARVTCSCGSPGRSRPNPRLKHGGPYRDLHDTRLLEQAKIDFGFYEERLDFQYLTALPLQDLLTELSHLPPQTLVFYTTLFRDGAGETLVPREVVERVSAAATAPTYGFLEQYVGRGIVGGDAYSR